MEAERAEYAYQTAPIEPAASATPIVVLPVRLTDYDFSREHNLELMLAEVA